MVVAIPPIDRSASTLTLELEPDDQRITLNNITWEQYETLLTIVGDRPGYRLTYLDGTLEILMPSPEHEAIKKTIARLLERYAEELDIIIHGLGSATFRKALKAKGLEPDECYCINQIKDVPDFAIEINLTSGGIDKLSIYKGLGIHEVLVWKNKALVLYDLRSDSPVIIDRSQFFPQLDLKLLAQHINPNDQPQSVKDFLNAIRQGD
jgi:Uma2 family endonuclease